MSARLSNAWGYLFAGVVALSLLAGLATGVGVSIWGGLEIARGIFSRDWPTVEGTVLSSGLVQARDDQSVLADIVYAYEVAGKPFRGERQRYDGGGSYSGDRDAASRYLANYAAAGRTLVRYDPRHPERAVLEPGFQRPALFIFVGGVVVLAGSGIMTAILFRVFLKLRKTDELRLAGMGKDPEDPAAPSPAPDALRR